MNKAKNFSQYVLDWQQGLANTTRAEDRPLYEKYLSHAAVILAWIETGITDDDLFAEISTHERLWGHTWLQDSAYKVPAKSYSNFRDLMGYK